MEDDSLDLMLPTKKKKSKKVDFDEGETLEKDDSENKPLYVHIGEFKEDVCNNVCFKFVSSAGRRRGEEQ